MFCAFRRLDAANAGKPELRSRTLRDDRGPAIALPRSMGAELGRLLEAEQAFATRVEAARRDARALVEAARNEARSLAGNSTALLERGRRELAEQEERALATELARVEADTSARVERLSTVTDVRVAALADQLLRALLAGDCS